GKIHTGMVHVNDATHGDEPIVPYGGEKPSGIGRLNGQSSIDELTTPQVPWTTAAETTHTNEAHLRHDVGTSLTAVVGDNRTVRLARPDLPVLRTPPIATRP